MKSAPVLDSAGRRRSPATTEGRAPRNKGLRYPPDPPAVEEIVAVMHAAGDGPEGVRLCGIIVVLSSVGLRISEALALNETDLTRAGVHWLFAAARAISAVRSNSSLGMDAPGPDPRCAGSYRYVHTPSRTRTGDLLRERTSTEVPTVRPDARAGPAYIRRPRPKSKP